MSKGDTAQMSLAKTFGWTAPASALGRRQIAGESVAEEKVSRASLAVRGDCVVELGWASPSVLGGPTPATVATTPLEELS